MDRHGFCYPHSAVADDVEAAHVYEADDFLCQGYFFLGGLSVHSLSPKPTTNH